MITELHYSNTNTYYITGRNGALLFDTGWAGTFPKFLKALGENNLKLADIKYLLISHYHPDHMGIAREIADKGTTLAVMDVQKDHIHDADEILLRDSHCGFEPIDDGKVRIVPVGESTGDGDSVYELVRRITKLIDKGYSVDEIRDITGADPVFIQDAARMYLTHPGVSVQGILDRIEIKGK